MIIIADCLQNNRTNKNETIQFLIAFGIRQGVKCRSIILRVILETLRNLKIADDAKSSSEILYTRPVRSK